MGRGFLLKAVFPLTILVVLVFSLISTPAGVIIRLMDPYSGVLKSLDVGETFSGRIKLQGLKDRVVVVFDSNNIPYIFAESEEDAFYALGYLHAWYRLWQMDIQRRLASGRLSEIIGPETIDVDRFMRIVGLKRSAEKTAGWLMENHEAVYRLLAAYSMGVNQAISKMKSENRLPLMFKLLGYEPEPWSVADSILWAKYMAWTLTNFWYPLALTYLYIKLDPEDVNILWPVHPYFQDNVTVVPGSGAIDELSINVDPDILRGLNWFEEWATGLDLKDPELSSKLEYLLIEAMEMFGELPRGIGSNNWVVSPGLSSTGYAMLANDPHLPLNLPSLWFIVGVKAGNYSVVGATLPGIPFPIIGSNGVVAWGLTNAQIGVIDFYLEKLDPGDPTRYYFNGEWLEMSQVKEVIRVKGGDDIELTINITVHGPIIAARDGLAISFRWTGNAGFANDGSGVTRESIAAYYMARARDLNDFTDALRFWDVPSQNIVYADIYGNIAVFVPGLFPVRVVALPTGVEVPVIGSRSILNGTGGYEWIGYVPYEHMPKSINPDRGYIATANQMNIGPYYPYFILGGWWDPGGRAHRIHMLLDSKDMHGLEDMARYQSDVFDWYSYMVLNDLIDAVRDADDPRFSYVIDLLSRWDHLMLKDRVEPTIWWAWFSALQDAMFRSYLTDRGVTYRFYPPPSTVVWLIKNAKDSKWFSPSFEDVARESLSTALDRLEEMFGSDIGNWSWGKVHRLYLAHLSMIPELSRGPFPEDGGFGTLMNAPIPWDLDMLEDPVYVRNGPSWRFLAVMSPQTPGCKIYGVYPGGQSGNPVSVFYDNYVDLWLTYRYIKLQCPNTVEDIEKRIAVVELVPGD